MSPKSRSVLDIGCGGGRFRHQLPYDYFDTVVSSFALHDMPYAGTIQRITELLKATGEVILVDIESGYKPLVRERTTQACWAIKNDRV